MELGNAEKIIDSCMEDQEGEVLDAFEKMLREKSMTLEELYILKDEIRDFNDEQASLVSEMYLARRKATDEYYEIAKKLKKINSFEKDKKKAAESLKLPTFLFVTLIMALKATSTTNLRELLVSFLSVILATAIVNPITYSKRKLTLINNLEKIGDLDDLMMRYYDASERDRGYYDAYDIAKDKSRVAEFCEARVDNVIDDLEDEEALQYIRM